MSYSFFETVAEYKSLNVLIHPRYRVGSADPNLMIKGGKFYAIFDEEDNRWYTTIEQAAIIIDRELYKKRDELTSIDQGSVKVLPVSDFSTKYWSTFLSYVNTLSDNFKPLDRTIIFQDTPLKRELYSTMCLPYSLSDCETPNYETLISTLYEPSEREKIEWAIGSIFTGDSRSLQKFIVFYGAPGTGKSTMINIIQMLFKGYWAIFNAKDLGNKNASFSLETLRDNPLVGIQHDGDLSGIEDNTKLNSLIAHESLSVNEKFKSAYSMAFDTFLIMGTNKPVRITDSKSGIVRRLIDIYPSGKTLSGSEYNKCMTGIQYELGGIAKHCIDVFNKLGKRYYNNYIPVQMISSTNDLYNFVVDNANLFDEKDMITLSEAWRLYKDWCTDSNVKYPYQKRIFKNELAEYFDFFYPQKTVNSVNHKNLFLGFRRDKVEADVIFADKESDTNETDTGKLSCESEQLEIPDWLKLTEHSVSIFDTQYPDWLAQGCTENETPRVKWDNCTTTLKDISPTTLHYVLPVNNHIVLDFDLKDEDGNKSLELNLKAASEFPPTYAECSKSGQGIHLHYIYTGDPTNLAPIISPGIEIKTFIGKASLRRKLSLCNDHYISELSSGLPLKGVSKVVNWDGIKSERQLRTMITKNLNKKYHADTRSSMDYIKHILDTAYDTGLSYDVSDMRQAVLTFAMHSTNQSKYCVNLIDEIKWKSDSPNDYVPVENTDEKEFIFYDVEVFPNLFVVCYKRRGTDKPVRALINPTSEDIETLCKFNLIGFNNRNYDNHILYARMMGYTNKQLYSLSQKIINGDSGKFAEAYNLSYADIYDYAAKRQSLKKWEIELKIHHLELGLEWDKPVPEKLWDKVAEYCKNDVISTEAVFEATIADFDARCILVELANIFADRIVSVVNDSTNTLTARIIFGNERHPSSEFIYTDLSEEFPGYKFENGVSTYNGEVINEGGYVCADPGMYYGLETLDIAGMHASSAFALNIFGDRYTNQYKLLYDLRIFIKHKDIEGAKRLFDGKLDAFLDDPSKLKPLSKALKLAINRVYGQTFTSYDNPFKDPRNVDNIIAKRGALFMASLKHELEMKNVHIIHIKTDSIKCEHMTPDIREFIIDYGKKYGYTFETEHIFDQFCLVNDAVYIAKTASNDPEMPNQWTATGTQFAVPYVFKTLFSGEEIEFEDLCETKSVSKGSIYLDMNENLEDVIFYEDIKEYRKEDPNKLTKKALSIVKEYSEMTDEELDEKIAKGHNYKFVGRVSSFCPIKSGCGGGVLYRYDNGKYSAVTGTKGYRWLEAEEARNYPNIFDIIDYSYYDTLVQKAAETINKFGDFDDFVEDLPF